MERSRKYAPGPWPQENQGQKVEKKSIPHLMPHLFLPPPSSSLWTTSVHRPLQVSSSATGPSDRRGDGPGCHWSTRGGRSAFLQLLPLLPPGGAATRGVRGGAEAGGAPARRRSTTLAGKEWGDAAAHLGPARPAEMGSFSSALVRSRSAVVQLGSSPPQREEPPAAPAARRDPFAFPKTRRLGPESAESPDPPAAWEAHPVARSPEARAKLESPELSAVLKRAESMSQPYMPQSGSATGESSLAQGCRNCRELLPGDPWGVGWGLLSIRGRNEGSISQQDFAFLVFLPITSFTS